MLILSDRTPLAEGYMRRVYAHPQRADALVKVLRPEQVALRMEGAGNWLRRRGRVRQYTVYLREIREYLALSARATSDVPIARMLGLAETDLGLGQLVEYIRNDDGGPAPTLIDLFSRHGDAAWLREGVDALFDALLRHHVVVSDMNPGNVVYGRGSDDVPRFALIDGFGEKNVIPLCSISRRYHAHRIARFRRKLDRQVAIVLSGKPLWPK